MRNSKGNGDDPFPFKTSLGVTMSRRVRSAGWLQHAVGPRVCRSARWLDIGTCCEVSSPGVLCMASP